MNNIKRISTLNAFTVFTAFAVCGAAQAQEKFPTKNIRMLVPFAAGSQTDILARWIGEKFLESWGQQVVVDNRQIGRASCRERVLRRV